MFRFEYTLATISKSKYNQLMEKELIEELKQGGHTWLSAVLAIIPFWSGASHGTFVKFAEKLGMSVNLSLNSSVAMGLGPGAGISASAAKLRTSKSMFVLEYSTSLWHLVYNEYNNANNNPVEGKLFSRLSHPGPYNFQNTGGEAFRAFAAHVRLPSPFRALELKKYKV